MKTAIDVENKREGDLVRQALADPDVRAYVNIMGALLGLDRERAKRVLAMVNNQLEAAPAPAGK